MEKNPHVEKLAAAAKQHPQWQWYAIADSAQNKVLPGALTSASGQVRSLLGATQGSPLAEKSPHLVAMSSPLGGAGWEWIVRTGARQPCVTVVASQLPFDALFDQLKQFAEIRLPDDTEMFFAFWDPAILGTLIGQPDDATLHIKGPVFDTEQRAMLYGGLTGWWYWDRDGAMHNVAIDAVTPTVRLTKPLKLTQHQVDELVEASMPDHVLYYVDLNQPHLLMGLETMKDMVNYVCVSLIYGKRLREDRAIGDLLARVKNGELKFSAAMNLMPK